MMIQAMLRFLGVFLLTTLLIGCAGGEGRAGAGESGTGRVRGLFIGMTRYPNERAWLPGAAQDTIDLRIAFERQRLAQGGDILPITNAAATYEDFRFHFDRLVTQVRPEDLFVFYFSGHGGERELALYDRMLGAEELDRLLARIPAERIIVMLDTCRAGSFSSIIGGRRVGIFSSRGDEVSWNTEDGGYLGNALRRAVLELDRDGQVTFGDLNRYVASDYDAHVPTTQHAELLGGSNQVLWWSFPAQPLTP